MVKRNIKIIKSPLEPKDKVLKYNGNFPQFGELYLELLENTSKINQDLINTAKTYNDQISPMKNNTHVSHNITVGDISSSEEERFTPKKLTPFENVKTSIKYNGFDETPIEYDKDDTFKDEDDKYNGFNDTENPDKLIELLRDDTYIKQSPKEKYEHEKRKETIINDMVDDRRIFNKQPPPTISELKNKGVIPPRNVPRDLNVFSNSLEQDNKKRELLYKIQMLKQSYPELSSTFPEFTIYSELNEMQREFEIAKKRISVQTSVGDYKNYLIYGFAFSEYALGKWMNLDMAGFTTQQISSLNLYNDLLIELGEKSYIPAGSSYPVEVRLLGMVLLQTGLFVISKILTKKGGLDILGMAMGNATKPKMSGPMA